jgi:signal transduction histidine kinase
MRGVRSLGLVGLRERAVACGGELSIWGAPGRGTTVLARIPLRPSTQVREMV